MGLESAFADDVGPLDFIEEHLEEIFEDLTDWYAKVSDVDLVMNLILKGDDGGEWTIVASDAGLDVDDGTTSSALVTILGDADAWPALRGPLKVLFEAGLALAERKKDVSIPADKRLTNQRLTRLEDVKGWAKLVLQDLPDFGDTELSAVFNDATPEGKALVAKVDMPALLELVENKGRLKSLVSSGKVSAGGDMALSVRIMAAVA